MCSLSLMDPSSEERGLCDKPICPVSWPQSVLSSELLKEIQSISKMWSLSRYSPPLPTQSLKDTV